MGQFCKLFLSHHKGNRSTMTGRRINSVTNPGRKSIKLKSPFQHPNGRNQARIARILLGTQFQNIIAPNAAANMG
jgi:hypothetical protein